MRALAEISISSSFAASASTPLAGATTGGDPTALHNAARTGDHAALAQQLQGGGGGVHVDAEDATTGNSALHWAAVRDHPEAVLTLLEAGADPWCVNRGGLTARAMAEHKGASNSSLSLSN